MRKNIGVVSLGCPKNLVDTEIMLGKLKKEDYIIVSNEAEADIIIVNTCGFIDTAKQESIDTILEMAGHKKDRCELLIVTGCLAERYRHKIIDEIPEVDAVVGTGSYSGIAEIIEKAYAGIKPEVYGQLDDTEYLRNSRVLSTGKGFAYLKISEGCDNRCTYCIIPKIRGNFRSRRMEDIVDEAEVLVANGALELVLIAQDTTRYGMDLYKDRKLVELIRKISAIEGLGRIRLLYCYPEEIDDSLIDEIADNPKLCKYLDIPIQHVSDRILKSMGRRGSGSDLRTLLDKVRQRIPDIILRTSLIVGFPDESPEDFEELVTFVGKYKFDRLGVFMYSREEGTPAAAMKRQILKKVKKERFDIIMRLQQDIAGGNNRLRLCKSYRVLVEGISDDGIFYCGRSYAEAPDIDGTIYFTSQEPIDIGLFVNVKILNTDNYDLIGEVENESAE